MKTSVVIGAGFGDEGKGKVTDYLCSTSKKPAVARFTGGQQAGHHVITETGKDHVFSNFGSGTLRGAPTYWLASCTIDPEGILNELKKLKDLDISPKLYIDAKCPVTTPFDMLAGRSYADKTKNGTVGVGVGATFQREEDMYSLLVEDLFIPSVAKIKLGIILDYYFKKEVFDGTFDYSHSDIGFLQDRFLSMCSDLIKNEHVEIYHGAHVVSNEYDHFIFEGSQGLLLDHNIGFFPYVTRNSKYIENNCDAICELNPTVYLVTRAYQTRHGNGPMTNENIPNNIKENPYEKNGLHKFQGEFRKSLLDVDLLKYSVAKSYFNKCKTVLVITCVDLIKNEYRYIENEDIKVFSGENDFIDGVSKALKIDDVLISRSPVSTEIEQF